MVCLMVSLVATSVAYAGSDKMMDVSRVDEETRQIFGNVKIKSSEYHYGGCGPIVLIGQLDFLARYAIR